MSDNMDKQKLIEILKNNNVHLSERGEVCLLDLAKNVVQSKNPDLYISNLKNKTIITDDNDYISLEKCFEILKNTNFRRCKKICAQLQSKNRDKINNKLQIDNSSVIKRSENLNDGNLPIDKEPEKSQKSDSEFLLSDNYKLKFQRDMRMIECNIRKIEAYERIALKNIELKIQYEKNIELALKKGYDLSSATNRYVYNDCDGYDDYVYDYGYDDYDDDCDVYDIR